jgi:hypothetical protein
VKIADQPVCEQQHQRPGIPPLLILSSNLVRDDPLDVGSPMRGPAHHYSSAVHRTSSAAV